MPPGERKAGALTFPPSPVSVTGMRRIALLGLVLVLPGPAQAVINGGPAEQAKTPWIASYPVEGGRCAGTLLDTHWILTAAHCAEHVATWGSATVRVNPAVFGKGGPVYTADRAVIHPGFRPGGKLPNDIALLHVTTALPGARVLLNRDADRPREAQKLRVYGFGATGPKDRNGSRRLLVGKVLDRAGPAGRCGRWKRSRFDAAIQLCANEPAGRVDACGGDSGGPLIMGSRRQVGIVSSGGDYCDGDPDRPGLYTRVSAYTGWIERAKTAAQILVDSPQCPLPDRACEVSQGQTVTLTVRNAGAKPGRWNLAPITASVSVSSLGGVLAAGQSTQVQVTALTGADVCAPVRLRGANLRPTEYKVYLNGGFKGC